MGEMGAEWLRCSRTWLGMGVTAPGEALLACPLVTIMDCTNRVELGQLARTFGEYCYGRIQKLTDATRGKAGGLERRREKRVGDRLAVKASCIPPSAAASAVHMTDALASGNRLATPHKL